MVFHPHLVFFSVFSSSFRKSLLAFAFGVTLTWWANWGELSLWWRHIAEAKQAVSESRPPPSLSAMSSSAYSCAWTFFSFLPVVSGFLLYRIRNWLLLVVMILSISPNDNSHSSPPWLWVCMWFLPVSPCEEGRVDPDSSLGYEARLWYLLT